MIASIIMVNVEQCESLPARRACFAHGPGPARESDPAIAWELLETDKFLIYVDEVHCPKKEAKKQRSCSTI